MSSPSPSALDPAVLAAGRRVLARHGYHGASAERLAAEAGVSRVTLHRKGITKDSILVALTEQAVHAYRAALWPALTGHRPAVERLEAALRALCDVAEDHLELLLALQSRTDGVFHEADVEDGEGVLTRSVFTEPIERLLADGAADGSLRVLDRQATATLLFNLVGWTYIHLRSGHRWPAETARERTIDIALHGLGTS
jgi:AcrR family transcriptional regulator